MKRLEDWWEARVRNLGDGFLVFFLVGASIFQGGLAAAVVIFPLALGWELLNPDQRGFGDVPTIIYWIGYGVFGFVTLATAGHAFTANGLRGFGRD